MMHGIPGDEDPVMMEEIRQHGIPWWYAEFSSDLMLTVSKELNIPRPRLSSSSDDEDDSSS